MKEEDWKRIRKAWRRDLEQTNSFMDVKSGGCLIAADDPMLRLADKGRYPSTGELLEAMKR